MPRKSKHDAQQSEMVSFNEGTPSSSEADQIETPQEEVTPAAEPEIKSNLIIKEPLRPVKTPLEEDAESLTQLLPEIKRTVEDNSQLSLKVEYDSTPNPRIKIMDTAGMYVYAQVGVRRPPLGLAHFEASFYAFIGHPIFSFLQKIFKSSPSNILILGTTYNRPSGI